MKEGKIKMSNYLHSVDIELNWDEELELTVLKDNGMDDEELFNLFGEAIKKAIHDKWRELVAEV